MRIARPFMIAAALAVSFTIVSTADAQPRHKRQAQSDARPLTVKKRSFLDPSKVVPVGSESNYVQVNTIFNRDPTYFYARSRYGQETLPGRFDLPLTPLFNF